MSHGREFLIHQFHASSYIINSNRYKVYTAGRGTSRAKLPPEAFHPQHYRQHHYSILFYQLLGYFITLIIEELKH